MFWKTYVLKGYGGYVFVLQHRKKLSEEALLFYCAKAAAQVNFHYEPIVDYMCKHFGFRRVPIEATVTIDDLVTVLP